MKCVLCTHPEQWTHTHTWSSGQPALRRPGSSWGFGALLKGLTSVVDNSCRSWDSNPQPRVTSPTLYSLGHDCPCYKVWVQYEVLIIFLKMNEWMNDALYSALLCIAVQPKRFTIVSGGGGGGFLSQPPPVCSIHLDEPIETCTLGDILLLETSFTFLLDW